MACAGTVILLILISNSSFSNLSTCRLSFSPFAVARPYSRNGARVQQHHCTLQKRQLVEDLDSMSVDAEQHQRTSFDFCHCHCCHWSVRQNRHWNRRWNRQFRQTENWLLPVTEWRGHRIWRVDRDISWFGNADKRQQKINFGLQLTNSPTQFSYLVFQANNKGEIWTLTSSSSSLP